VKAFLASLALARNLDRIQALQGIAPETRSSLKLSPTKHEDWIVLRGDDLRLKERVTVCVTGAGAG